jgi:hypothetical protein
MYAVLVYRLRISDAIDRYMIEKLLHILDEAHVLRLISRPGHGLLPRLKHLDCSIDSDTTQRRVIFFLNPSLISLSLEVTYSEPYDNLVRIVEKITQFAPRLTSLAINALSPPADEAGLFCTALSSLLKSQSDTLVYLQLDGDIFTRIIENTPIVYHTLRHLKLRDGILDQANLHPTRNFLVSPSYFPVLQKISEFFGENFTFWTRFIAAGGTPPHGDRD